MNNALECTEYGHLHLGFWFRPIVAIDEYGLSFRGRRYSWGEIEGLEEMPPGAFFAFGYPFGKPGATIKFCDGVSFRIDGTAFTKRNERPRTGFWTATSETFEKFIELIRYRMRENPRNQDSSD